MVQLYGKRWSRRELEAHVGRLEQIGGIHRLKLVEGIETNVEQVRVRPRADA